MIIFDCEQGSPEWHEARRGIPSASNFGKLLTNTMKDGHYTRSTQRAGYVNGLIGGRMGSEKESFQTAAMERGLEMEPNAVAMYELQTGNETQKVGLCYKDENKTVSASPDRLVGDDGLVEIKSPLRDTQVGYLRKGELPTTYRAQCLGQLYVCEREWLDFVSYHPDLPMLIVRVYPDKDYFRDLDKELKSVEEEVSAEAARLSMLY